MYLVDVSRISDEPKLGPAGFLELIRRECRHSHSRNIQGDEEE
jgi:hypothetical protein